MPNMPTIVLLEPQIPPNTGNVARLCAATKTRLEIVGDIGFELSDKTLKRAGLDYWPHVDWEHKPDLDAYMNEMAGKRVHLLTTKSNVPYWSRSFGPDDYLIFGRETTGIPEVYRTRFSESCCTIPMASPHVRSLNLSTAVGIVLYEAIRQLQGGAR